MEPNQNEPVVAQPSGEKKSLGPIIGIVVVVILLVLGALYVWGGKLSNKTAPVPAAATSTDDVGAIEKDLSGNGEVQIDLTGLDNLK